MSRSRISRRATQTAWLTGTVRAKRAVPFETWWVFRRAWGLRARCYFRTTGWTVRWHSLNASVCRRFLCFCFFVAVGQRNEVPPRTGANSTKQENPRLNSLRLRQNRPTLNSLRLGQNHPTLNPLRLRQNHPTSNPPRLRQNYPTSNPPRLRQNPRTSNPLKPRQNSPAQPSQPEPNRTEPNRTEPQHFHQPHARARAPLPSVCPLKQNPPSSLQPAPSAPPNGLPGCAPNSNVRTTPITSSISPTSPTPSTTSCSRSYSKSRPSNPT